jgi:fibronectin-binding autotransporter adhesin
MCSAHRLAVAAGVLCRRRIVPSSLKLSLVLLSTLAASRAALGASGSNTWYSGATSSSWPVDSSWGSGIFNTIVPGANSGTTNTDTATFNTGSFVTAITPDASRNLENITFDTSAAAYTIGTTGGNALLMTSFGTIQIASSFSASNRTETIDAPLTLEGDYTLADNSANAGVLLDFGGAINAADQGGSVLTVAGAGNTSISGAIGGSKTIDLAKSGAGMLTLGGNNTFTGGVTINAGTLAIGADSNLGGSSGALNFSGGSLESSASLTLSAARAVMLNAGGGTFNVDPSTTLTIGQTIAGAGGLTKSGAGTLTLSGNNTFTGGVTINAGTLQLANPGALNTSGTNGVVFGGSGTLALNGNSVTISNLSSGFSSVAVVQNANAAAAALTVNNSTSNVFNGTLQDGIGGGPLSLIKNGVGALTVGDGGFSGNVTINAGALQLEGFPMMVLGSVTFGPGSAGVLQFDANYDTNFLGITISGLTTNANVGTPSVVLHFVQGNHSSAPNQFDLTVNNATDNTFNGVLADDNSSFRGTLDLVKSGGGTLTLGGSSTFTGGVTIFAGRLQLGNAGALNSASPNAVNFGYQSTGTLALNGYSLTVPGLTTDPAIVGTPVVENASTSAVTLTVNTAGDNTYAGTLTDGPGTGTLSLTKTGAGTLALSGNNSFTGGTTVTGGTLYTSGGGTLGTGPLTISAANGVTSTVSLGKSQTVSSLSGTLGATAVITLTVGSGVTLTDNQSSGNTSFQGVLINSGTFVKSGTSSLEINSAPTLNTNSVLQVSGGKMRFNFVTGAATIGTRVTATIATGATLELAGSVSALSSGANRVNVTNNSNSTGLLVSGTNQHVGNIDGLGTTQVNAGSDLTADHIIQSALVIGGASNNPGFMTIDASDSAGNPLGQSSGLALAGSLSSSGPFGAGGISSANLNGGGSTDLAAQSAGNPAVGGNLSVVPEPSTFSLALLAILGVVSTQFARHHFRCQTV